jgi:hypothetical protein
MENTEKIIRELANLYGIEILDEPTGHVFVDQNGVENPLRPEDYHKVFSLSSDRYSSSDFLKATDCQPIHNHHYSLEAQNHSQGLFNGSNNIGPVAITQYTMAA